MPWQKLPLHICFLCDGDVTGRYSQFHVVSRITAISFKNWYPMAAQHVTRHPSLLAFPFPARSYVILFPYMELPIYYIIYNNNINSTPVLSVYRVGIRTSPSKSNVHSRCNILAIPYIISQTYIWG